MLVTTNAPIVEETSSANGRKKRTRKKSEFGQKATEKLKQGYSRVKEAGGLPVIENLLGLNQGAIQSNTGTIDAMTPPPPPPPQTTGMSKNTKIFIGVLVVGAIAGAIYYFTKVKGKKAKGSSK